MSRAGIHGCADCGCCRCQTVDLRQQPCVRVAKEGVETGEGGARGTDGWIMTRRRRRSEMMICGGRGGRLTALKYQDEMGRGGTDLRIEAVCLEAMDKANTNRRQRIHDAAHVDSR